MLNIIIICIIALLVGNGGDENIVSASAPKAQLNYAILNDDCEPTPVDSEETLVFEVDFEEDASTSDESGEEKPCRIGFNNEASVSIEAVYKGITMTTTVVYDI